MRRSFLQEGAKVKAYVFFKGRSIVYNEDGEALACSVLPNELAEIW